MSEEQQQFWGDFAHSVGWTTFYTINPLSSRVLLCLFFSPIPPEAPLWPKEVLEPVVVPEGHSLVLNCSPPPGLPPPFTFWMNSGERQHRSYRMHIRKHSSNTDYNNN